MKFAVFERLLCTAKCPF